MPNSNQSRILITGGAGFIGSNLAESLADKGSSVLNLDNFDPYYDLRLKEQNAAALDAKGIDLVRADIRDANTLTAVFRDFAPQTIIHIAAKAGVRPSLENPQDYVDVNVHGTTTLLEVAREAGIRDIVFASSSSVYGASEEPVFRESDRTDLPLSPYGATKKACEVLLHAWHHLYGFSIACLRFFTVYGPRQRPDLAIRKFCQLALEDKKIQIYGDGTSSRDYTHVTDVVRGIEGAIDWVNSGEPRFDIFNLGSSHPIELREMISIIESTLGREIRKQHIPMQPGDVPRTFADTSKAEHELGYKQQVSFKDGLRDFVQWLKSNQV